jgi:AcrR family transcriptional regulator
MRAGEILIAARRLLAVADYDSITMSAVAKEAYLAKGTPFLYFESKEELFLTLAEEDMEAWAGRLEDSFAGLPPGAGVSLVAKTLARTAAEGGLCKLAAIMDDTLEANISALRAFAFKRRMLGVMTRGGAALEGAIPELADGEGAALLQVLFACLVGAWKVATPSVPVREAIALPGMEVFRVNFESLLARMCECQIRGSLSRGTNS